MAAVHHPTDEAARYEVSGDEIFIDIHEASVKDSDHEGGSCQVSAMAPRSAG